MIYSSNVGEWKTMKIVAINASGKGNTADVMHAIGEYAKTQGIEYLYVVGKKPNASFHDYALYPCSFARFASKSCARFSGNFDSWFHVGTKKLIRFLDKVQPDIVHLHNLHGEFLNFKMLFEYLMEKQIQVVYSVHDAWPFTGKCRHFEDKNCLKWKTVCKNCPKAKENPRWLFGDSVTRNHQKKIHLLLEMKKIVFVPTYVWMKTLLSKSPLKKKEMTVIYNGVDTSIFKQVPSRFRKEEGIPEDKIIILCVQDKWSKENGIDMINCLASYADSRFVVVAVGEEHKGMSKKIHFVSMPKKLEDLVKIYSASNVFLNTQKYNQFPKEIVRALACGLPVFSLAEGGIPEQIDQFVGRILAKDSPDVIIKAIESFYLSGEFLSEQSLRKALEFSSIKMCEQYFSLYSKLITGQDTKK